MCAVHHRGEGEHLSAGDARLWFHGGPSDDVAARVFRDRVLAGLTGEAAPTIDHEPGGRPFLPAHAGLSFSLAHTPGAAVMLTGPVALGVDIERADRTLRQPDALARRILGADEHARWSALSGAQARHFLLGRWTLKEAWLKALGLGVRGGLRSCVFDTSGPRITGTRHDTPGDWHFGQLAKDGYLIAWAVAADCAVTVVDR